MPQDTKDQDTKDIIAALPLATRAVKMIVDRFQTHSRYLSPDLRIRVLAGSSSRPLTRVAAELGQWAAFF